MKRRMVLYWSRFVRSLCTLPDPAPSQLALISEAEALFEKIQSGNISMGDLLDLPEDVLDAAWRIVYADDRMDPLAEQVQMRVDDNVWNELVRECLRFEGLCDPDIGSEFL